jgi:hypothetical protein
LYFWVRKELGISRREWDALPWHDQDMYRDELERYLSGGKSGGEKIDGNSVATLSGLGVATRTIVQPGVKRLQELPPD